MLNSMVSILIIALIISIFYFSFCGLGYLFHFYINEKNLISNNLFPLISFPIVFSFLTYFHLLYKLSPFINVSVILLGLFIYVLKVRNKNNKIIYFICLAVVTIQFVGHNVNEDFGYYHLPYIINFVSDKIILGLGHLSMVQGYNSAWLNLNSLFYLPIFLDKTVHFLNSLILFSILIFYINFLLNKKNYSSFPISCLYAIFLMFFFIVKNSRLNSFGVDVPGHIFASLVLFLFFNFCENKDYYFRKVYFSLILIFSIFSILIKLSYVPLILIPLICIFIEIRVFEKKIILLSFLLGLPWIIQQVAYTSCFIFPVEFTCFKNLPWYSKDFIRDAAFSLEYINKSYWVYEGLLTESEYIKNFNWVRTWFSRNLIEILENILTFTIPILFFYFFTDKKKIYFSNRNFFLVLCPILVGLLIWFLKAPVVRYGIFYLNSFIFILLLFFFKKNQFPINKKFAAVILIFGLIFNLSKNINRVVNVDYYDEFPYPKIENIIYETKIYQNLTLNTPITMESNQSSVCWDVPVYCRPGKFDHLNIYKKKGYLIFTEKP